MTKLFGEADSAEGEKSGGFLCYIIFKREFQAG